MRILIVEDNANLADVINMGLSMEGLQTKAVYDGRDAVEELNNGGYDMVILDRDLPGIHGDDIARMLSERHDSTYVLMLTASSQIEDIVQGLNLGADDYLTKPFDYAVLLARVNAVRRRRSLSSDSVFHRGAFKADLHTGIVTVDGGRLNGGVVSTESLYTGIWHDDHAHTRGIVKTTIYALRTKIGIPDFIETIPGQGYRIP